MEQLQDALENFGWTQYEAACYAALVRFGPMKASRVASEAGIMQSKIYQPLNRLEDKGYVRITDENPKVYTAQNPQYVMELEQREFQQESQTVLEQLQEAWEIQEDLGTDTDHAWVVKGREGASMEISKLIDDAEDSIEAFDSRLARAPREALDNFEDRLEDGVSVRLVSGSQSRDRLERLQQAGAEVRELTELTRSSYYLVDGERVLLTLGSGDATIVFEDESLASIIRRDFEDTFNEGSEVSTNND